MEKYKYNAFICYSHDDKRAAAWLHRALERYNFPAHMVGKPTSTRKVPSNLRPIFRDREELSAGHDLGEKIEAALRISESLIVICSPSATRSYWVNQEILFFKRMGRERNIFALIVDGEPNATTDISESFPESLKYQLDLAGELTNIRSEPLAADLRASGDGRRLGLLKLIAGLVNLPVADLVQRDLARARKRMTVVTAAALSAMLVMSGLTWTAVDARKRAEEGRAQAEGQIEFMLTDLRKEVQKVGRLDALQIVADHTLAYYKQYPPKPSDVDAVSRLARAKQFSGVTLLEAKRQKGAISLLNAALETAKAAYQSDPNNPERVFAVSQAAFWRGSADFEAENYYGATPFYDMYSKYAAELMVLEPNSLRGRTEFPMAELNVAILLHKNGNNFGAIKTINKVLPTLEDTYQSFAENDDLALNLAYSYGWAADFHFFVSLPTARKYRQAQLDLISKLNKPGQDDAYLRHQQLLAVVGLSRVLLESEEYEVTLELISEHMADSVGLQALDPSSKYYEENVKFLEKFRYTAQVCLKKEGIGEKC